MKSRDFICILPVNHNVLHYQWRSLLTQLCKTAMKCHSKRRCSILTNMLFKLDKLHKKFASCRVAVAKINPRQAGTRSDVFSPQHKSWPLLAKNFQLFLGDKNKFRYILAVVNLVCALIHNCTKDDGGGFEPGLRAVCNFSFSISSEAFTFNQVAEILFILQERFLCASNLECIRDLAHLRCLGPAVKFGGSQSV